VLAACGPDARIEQSPDATLPGAEVPTTRDDVPANDPDTIAFIQQGRTLHFGGRDWLMVGEPIFNPILRYIGTAEGLDLYATPEQRAMASTLFFHLGNDRWQPLQPVPGPMDLTQDTMPGAADTQRVPPR
jgi:hypothetical protein